MADTPVPPPPAAPHSAGIASAATTIGGLAAVAATNPPTGWAGWTMFGIVALGSILQAFTKPVTAGNTDLVAKQP